MRASWCRVLPAFVRLEYYRLLLLQLHIRICNLTNHTQSCLSHTAACTFPNISLLASMPVLTLGVPPPLLFFLSKSSDPSAPRYFIFFLIFVYFWLNRAFVLASWTFVPACGSFSVAHGLFMAMCGFLSICGMPSLEHAGSVVVV